MSNCSVNETNFYGDDDVEHGRREAFAGDELAAAEASRGGEGTGQGQALAFSNRLL